MTAQLRFSRINSPGSSDSRLMDPDRIQELGEREERGETWPGRGEACLVRYDEQRDDQLGTHLVHHQPPATTSLNIGL